MSRVEVEREIAGRKLTIESGRMAKQANGSVLIRYADTVVLATVCAESPAQERDYFPLFVDYREKQYAAGKFPGGVIKREGRPTTKEILTMRLTDRPLRPLFPEGYMDEVQVMNAVLSTDKENDPDILSVNGAAAALAVSDIPFGPIPACVRVGMVEDELVVNPTHTQLQESPLDLVVAGTRDGVVMVEALADQVTEEEMIEAMELGFQSLQPIIEAIEDLAEKCGKPKQEFERSPLYDEALELIRGEYKERFEEAGRVGSKLERQAARKAVIDEALEKHVEAEDAQFNKNHVKGAFEKLEQEIMRHQVLNERTRYDGRDFTDIRELSCEVAIVPRVHGSGLFTRGETQALVITTLGTVTDEQRVLDSLTEEASLKFMLHYNFPPFSVGEVRPVRGPGRREIGHGNLAQRAILPVIPDEEEFPYTIRLVSDILESNGSSSMATVCGATLALMDAGVPLEHPVAGIAMGLIQGEDENVVLTDIAGAEDHYGDMDFKVAGTQHGITALQMDIKAKKVTPRTMGRALEQAKDARMTILKTMLDTLPEPREELSEYAPMLLRIHIDPDKIGLIIGPGGRTIKGLEEKTEAKIEIEEDGTVFISSVGDPQGAREAADIIENMTRDLEVGRIYEGRVIEVRDFGAIVELFPGQDGLVHISELDEGYVKNVEDVVKVGDDIEVKVINKDESGKVKLSRYAALVERGLAEPRPAREERSGGGGRGGRSGGGRSGGGKGGRGGGGRRR